MAILYPTINMHQNAPVYSAIRTTNFMFLLCSLSPVTVQCTKDGQFVVVVSRDATLPNLELDSISLLGANGAHCTPVGTTSAFAIYQFKVTECGTVVTVRMARVWFQYNETAS